jgi:benzil reductase ((S)-benzoin forming)
MQVNFTSAAILCNKFIKAFQNSPIQKLIFNISSGAATSPYESWSNYCSAKAALNMFTEVVHLEQATQKYPIQVFAIAPGVVDTAMQTKIRSTDVSKFPHKEKFIQLKENGNLYHAKRCCY